MERNTPRKIYQLPYSMDSTIRTPEIPISLANELKQVLNERNMLTEKSRKKVCSMLDSITPEKANDSHKRNSFRLQAIQEIISSERSYIKQLEMLMEYFIYPLKASTDLLTRIQFNAIFGQLEMIYNLNKELLAELEIDLDNVAKSFLRLAPFFKLYSVYAFDYSRAQIILQEATSKNVLFKHFLKQTESRPEVQSKLISLLIAPIQRVPRYRLLLQQVLLYSSPSEPDFQILQDSLKEVEKTVAHMNSIVQEQETTQLLIDLQNSLVNKIPNIVKPSRKIIKEGVLEKMASNGTILKRYCVLMSDIFMYCRIVKERKTTGNFTSNALQCCCIFPLKRCRILEMFPGTFKLTCKGDGIILKTVDATMCRDWVKSIKDAIELHVQCRKTIRKGSSKRTPIRNKDLKTFESDQIVSPLRKRNILQSVNQDHETVLRFDGYSSSEMNDSGDQNIKCFNILRRKLKRRHSNGEATNCSSSATESVYNTPQTIVSTVNSTSTILRQNNLKSSLSNGSSLVRKRVKFDENPIAKVNVITPVIQCENRPSRFNFTPTAAPPTNTNQGSLSLTQRLKNFFSTLY